METTMKHTDGPWEAKPVYAGECQDMAHTKRLVMYAIQSPSTWLADVTVAGNDNATHDARLIAAAPELLAVLESALEALWNVPEVGKKYDQQHSHTHSQACLDIQAVIAKAKGGA